MIYEIVVRGHELHVPSDNIIWIESNLPTRAFEQWLIERALLKRKTPDSPLAPVIRWRIVQTARPAHFVLGTEAVELEKRIAELMNPPVRPKKSAHSVSVLPNFEMSAFSLAV